MTSAITPESCRACGATLEAAANFCGQCGLPRSSSADPKTPLRTRWYHQTWFVLLMLTPFVLGPFALPLLWKSPKFSKGAKWVLTVITVGWTVLFVLYVVQHVIPAVMNEVNQINSSMQF